MGHGVVAGGRSVVGWVAAVAAGAVLVAAAAAAGAGSSAADEHQPACPDKAVAMVWLDDVVEGATHYDGPRCLAALDLAGGVGDDLFAPHRTLARGQMATLAVALGDLAAPGAIPDAEPVGPGTHDEAIARALAADPPLLEGFEDGTIGAYEPLTRGQAALVLHRLHAVLVAATDDALEPLDPLDPDAPHESAMEALAADGVGVLVGFADGTLRPHETMTRGQVATMTARLVDLLHAAGLVGAADTSLPDQPEVDELRLNHLQAIGTHNSYKLHPGEGILEGIALFLDASEAEALDYAHPPITEQLAEQRVRQLELDVFYDPEGGRYAEPMALELAGMIGLPEPPPYEHDGQMDEPGYKVLHAQDIDFYTSCFTLVSCLEEIRDWSAATPDHLPVMILVEVKQDPIPDPGDFGFVEPLPVGVDELVELEEEIASVFDPDDVILPDDVRGPHSALRKAVERDGWPTLEESRGKVMFVLDNHGSVRDALVGPTPSAEGRWLFPSLEPPHVGAAFVKLNSPTGASGERIDELARAGYVMRTRSDSPTVDAREEDFTRADAALAGGAQYISTDYPEPPAEFIFPEPFQTDFSVQLPGEHPARCNPVSAPDWCDDDAFAE